MEPNHPQRIISGLKTNFSIWRSYSIQKSLNHKSLVLKPQLCQIYFTNKTNTEQHTSYFITHISVPRKGKMLSTISKYKVRQTKHMFRRLFIIRGHSTREPASIVCNQEEGDLFYSTGLHRNRRYPQLTQDKLERGFGEKKSEWTRTVEISTEEIPGSRKHGALRPQAAGVALCLYTDLLPTLKGDPFSCVFSIDGALISASAAPRCGA